METFTVLRDHVVTAVVCCLLPLTTVDGGTEAEIIKALEETQQEVAWKYIPLSGPAIDHTNSSNITAQMGKTAILNCRIKYLGGKTVSWMRSRDLHLLTVGRFTYTSDDRFKSVHQQGSEDWLLKIHYVQHRDAGSYECQISTTPPMSKIVWLTVVETRVLGGPDLYINFGSTINLTCIVNHSPEPPPYIFWYHENELLSYDSPRGGITVVTEHGPSSSSRLLIQKAAVSDAGRYTCRPANADPHHITVHIIPNEHPAAIHHKNGTSTAVSLRHNAHTNAHVLLLAILFTCLFVSPISWLPSAAPVGVGSSSSSRRRMVVVAATRAHQAAGHHAHTQHAHIQHAHVNGVSLCYNTESSGVVLPD
ncbi:limbic system-associated membrane protein isoform X2 [Procambarus clarkii]|uniref:limbic system-associated membrane protein isoform X2 n=1 Tax=Procambarus clarkii TaxID=6728 RepID=UPI00374325C7